MKIIVSNSVATILKCATAFGMSATLMGCAPTAEPYLRVEAPHARYFDSTCGSVPPPDLAYFPYHGIYISAEISSGVLLGLHIPDGMVAQLDSDVSVIEGETSGGRHVSERVHWQVSPHRVIGFNMPMDFRTLDPFQAGVTTTLGPLRGGGSVYGLYPWYLFVGKDPTHPEWFFAAPPAGLEKGTMILPAMTINGKRYPPGELTIDKKRYIGFTPINC